MGDGQGFLGLGTSGMWLYDGMILGLFCVAVLLSAVAKVLWSRPSGRLCVVSSRSQHTMLQDGESNHDGSTWTNRERSDAKDREEGLSS